MAKTRRLFLLSVKTVVKPASFRSFSVLYPYLSELGTVHSLINYTIIYISHI